MDTTTNTTQAPTQAQSPTVAAAEVTATAPLFDPLLTVDEVAAWLRKPKATLYAWRSRSRGPRAIKVGGDLRYRRSDVEAWLEAQSDQPADQPAAEPAA